MKEFEKYTIAASESIRNAIKKMDIEEVNFLVVIDADSTVIGVFTSGNFREAVLKGVDIAENVSVITNRNYLYLNKDYSKKDAYELFKKDKVNDLPVIKDRKLIDIVHKEDLISSDLIEKSSHGNMQVVIMAGGKGTRLDPFTRILPKPLIPLGDEPIIKVIMDEFGKFGINNFQISLNDKGQMIKAYFHEHELPYNIQYIEEEAPLGTAGALKLLDGMIDIPFFVTNCDILVKGDYSEILNFHQTGGYTLTLVGSMKQYTIPYGICEIENSGELITIREKPDYDFLVNTGLYLLEPDVMNFIPENTHYDMTDLIDELKINNKKIGVFPVSEKSWIDIGQWNEYKKIMKEMEIK